MLRAVFQAVANGPAEVGGVGFGPPAVELRQVQAAIGQHLHAAGAAGLPGPPRRVQPDVHALHQVPGDAHVVVLEKDHAAGDVGPGGETLPLGQQRLPGAVGRMRLASHQQLHRAAAVVEDARQPFGVLQQQVGALVTGEATGEAKRQPFRMQA